MYSGLIPLAIIVQVYMQTNHSKKINFKSFARIRIIHLSNVLRYDEVCGGTRPSQTKDSNIGVCWFSVKLKLSI